MEISKSEAGFALFGLNVTANETELGVGAQRLRIRLAQYLGGTCADEVPRYEAELAACIAEEIAAEERFRNPPAFASRRRELRRA
jgi:hypothetical protein